ncbi:MAG: hypothetical protein ACM3H8_01615 [Sphingobacteriales bacterium]
MTTRVHDFISNNRDAEKRSSNIEGSVFINEQWNNGYLKLSDRRTAEDLPLRFNAYTNQIHF